MGSIMIKLRPSELTNPDADLRYVIPDKISGLMDNRVIDDGYDYLDDEFTTMAIFLKSDNIKDDVKGLLEILKNESFIGNNIYETAVVSICDKNTDDLEEYIIVHPLQRDIPPIIF